MVNPIQLFSIGHTTSKNTHHRWPLQIIQLSNREERLLGVLWVLRLRERIRSRLARRGTIPQLAVVSERINAIIRIGNQVRKVSMLFVGLGRAFVWVRIRKFRCLGCR